MVALPLPGARLPEARRARSVRRATPAVAPRPRGDQPAPRAPGVVRAPRARQGAPPRAQGTRRRIPAAAAGLTARLRSSRLDGLFLPLRSSLSTAAKQNREPAEKVDDLRHSLLEHRPPNQFQPGYLPFSLRKASICPLTIEQPFCSDMALCLCPSGRLRRSSTVNFQPLHFASVLPLGQALS